MSGVWGLSAWGLTQFAYTIPYKLRFAQFGTHLDLQLGMDRHTDFCFEQSTRLPLFPSLTLEITGKQYANHITLVITLVRLGSDPS